MGHFVLKNSYNGFDLMKLAIFTTNVDAVHEISSSVIKVK
jgi:hypothetical protein